MQDRIAESIFLEDIVYPNRMIRPEDFDQLAKENKHEVVEVVGKRMHDTAHGHPELVGTLDKCKFVTCKEAADRGVLMMLMYRYWKETSLQIISRRESSNLTKYTRWYAS